MGLFKKIVNAVLDNKVSPTRKDGRLDLRYKNAKTYQAAIQRKLDKDPELKEKFKEIEDDLESLGKKTEKITKKAADRYKGTPLEDFFKA